MYSEGAINSMVADLISGLLCGSPYVLVTGSKENSSGTAKDITDLNLWSISKFHWTSENKNSISLCDDPEPPFYVHVHELFLYEDTALLISCQRQLPHKFRRTEKEEEK